MTSGNFRGESGVYRREHVDSPPGCKADGQAPLLVGNHVAYDAVGVLLELQHFPCIFK